uniref:Uncharacterized protein n=1 Tax=Micrurus lemniscatus lemniscatus TaxID=129467 RepID=A0A2D4HHF6_MICLE
MIPICYQRYKDGFQRQSNRAMWLALSSPANLHWYCQGPPLPTAKLFLRRLKLNILSSSIPPLPFSSEHDHSESSVEEGEIEQDLSEDSLVQILTFQGQECYSA